MVHNNRIVWQQVEPSAVSDFYPEVERNVFTPRVFGGAQARWFVHRNRGNRGKSNCLKYVEVVPIVGVGSGRLTSPSTVTLKLRASPPRAS